MVTKGKILVVDDDRLVLATVTHGLAQAGYEVIDADNGDDAILLARQHRPDLALLDIRMEGKSGFDVAEYLRDVEHVPFIFLSAFSDAATVAQVNALGALAYLVKPLEIGQIVPAVDAAVERARSMAAAPGLASGTPAGVAVIHAARGVVGGVVGDLVGDVASDVLSDDPVPMAVGVLMHRFSLVRADALARLRRQSGAESRSLRAQANRVLQAVEDLAGDGG